MGKYCCAPATQSVWFGGITSSPESRSHNINHSLPLLRDSAGHSISIKQGACSCLPLPITIVARPHVQMREPGSRYLTTGRWIKGQVKEVSTLLRCGYPCELTCQKVNENILRKVHDSRMRVHSAPYASAALPLQLDPAKAVTGTCTVSTVPGSMCPLTTTRTRLHHASKHPYPSPPCRQTRAGGQRA